jgi:single-strand DNA-binding protein
MYNKVILVGYLTRNIELRYSPTGTAIAKTGIATNRTYKDTITGEQKQEAMFIDITIFGKSAEIANQWLHKGSKVLIEGRLILNQWIANDGTKRSKHEIIAEEVKFMDSKKEREEYGYGNAGHNAYSNSQPQPQPQPQRQNHQHQQSQPQQSKEEIPSIDIDEEDIPF